MRKALRICTLAVCLLVVGAETANAGFFQNLIRLEQRKNEWLRSLFVRR